MKMIWFVNTRINSWVLIIVNVNMEAVARRCSVKKVLLEISQNSLENACARVSFFNRAASLKPVNTWSLGIQTLNLLGMQTSQNEWVPLLQFTWPNHAKVIKLQPLKLRWWKFSFLQDTWSFSMWYPDKWRASNQNFYKSFNVLNLKEKNKQTIKCIYSLGSKIKWSMLYLETN